MDSNMIAISSYCIHYQIEPSFVTALEEEGLVAVTRTDHGLFISIDQLADLERYKVLFYELNINVEGIDVIHHLLNVQRKLQSEIHNLQNRLRLYEPEND